ncbi:MAG: hypothetical protein GDA36_00545 [Rhodobacteraceae bacterium]|nr:hypothetical protein [Paracoccaceae bacterium]
MSSFKENLAEIKRNKIPKWSFPDKSHFIKEYKIEMEMKGHNCFSRLNEFIDAINNSKVEFITSSKDTKIGYRSRTKSQKQLLNLIKTYRSYPEFRNEHTLQNLYDRIRSGLEMDMPIVLEFTNGSRRIMSGNTRADVAMQLYDKYEAIIVEVP